MPLQTFRYAACGGGNTLLDITLFSLFNDYIFKKQIVYTPIIPLESYTASFMISFAITFPLGFYMSRNIVFPGSTLRGRIQLFRYFMMVLICIGLNYTFIKLFVEKCHLDAKMAKVLTTFIVVAFSFVTQKNFTFKVESPEEEALLEAETVVETEALQKEKSKAEGRGQKAEI
jgi:putative flippase GtrA